MEYMVLSMFYGFNEFDCEVFIPDLDNVVMHGYSIKFDAQVLKKLSEKRDHDLAARKVMFIQRSKYSCCHMFKKNTETTQYLTSLAASFLAVAGGCVASRCSTFR
jgi:23S rRNA maturation mini-RNase III